MSAQNLLLVNISIISVFQIYLMVSYLRKKKPGKFFENLIVFSTIILFLLYAYFSNLNIPSFIITCSIITVIGHSYIGTYLNIYYKSKIYDRFLHLFGSFSYSLFSFSIINNIIPLLNDSRFYISLFVMTLGITIGVFFEIAEFIHDCLSRKVIMQHGLADTNFDMICNVLGAFIAGIVSTSIF